jgi:hypothetical protein
MAEILQTINSSPGDLAPVFDAILAKAVRLSESAFGMLLTWDGERFHRVAWQGLSAEQIEATRQPVSPAPPPGAPGYRIAQGEDVVCIADLAEEVMGGRVPPIQTLVRLGGRSYVMVALRKDDRLLGAMAIFRREVRPFTDKEVALLQNFAAQAVIAMENARLLGELRTRTNDLEESLEYQTATSDVLKIISRTDARINAVLDTLVRRASHICGADQAVLHQLRDGLHYVVASFGAMPEYEEYVARNPIKPGRGTAIGRMSLESRVIHIDDVLQDTEYTRSGGGSAGGGDRSRCARPGRDRRRDRLGHDLWNADLAVPAAGGLLAAGEAQAARAGAAARFPAGERECPQASGGIAVARPRSRHGEERNDTRFSAAPRCDGVSVAVGTRVTAIQSRFDARVRLPDARCSMTCPVSGSNRIRLTDDIVSRLPENRSSGVLPSG